MLGLRRHGRHNSLNLVAKEKKGDDLTRSYTGRGEEVDFEFDTDNDPGEQSKEEC